MLHFRPKTLRRLGWFLAVAVLMLVLALGLRQRELGRQNRMLSQQREQGLGLLAVADYPGALAALGTYLSEAEPGRVERDFEARLAYAVARARIYDTGERHLEQAGRMLRDLADDFPAHARRTEALHLLMNIAAAGREWAELRRLCDETLDQRPGDAHALRMRREAAEQLGDYSSALADTQHLLSLAPASVEEHLWTLRLMARLGNTPQEIITHAIDLTSRYPQDPRYLLVLAAAYRHAGQEQQALACLNQAQQLELPSEDPAGFVVRLVGLLDTFGEHAQAMHVYAASLSRARDEAARDLVQQLLALRLWQAGRLDEALAVVPAPPAEQRRRNIELYATRILLQFERGEVAQAEQGLTSLGRIAEATDLAPVEKRRVMAWHEALRAAYAPASMTQRQRLEALQTAFARTADLRDSDAMIAIDRPTGVFLKWIGDRYWELGEYQEAIVHWRRAADSLPGWADPLLRVAEASIKLGALEQAQRAAQAAAVRLGPQADEPASVLRAQIAYARWLAAPSTSDAEQAAALAGAHQRQRPLDPGTLAVHVHMLSLTDPQQARQLVRQRLERGAPAQVRVELARVSRMAKLGLEQELLAEVAHPEAALLRAQMLADEGQSERALELFSPPASAATREQVPPALDWDIARARFLSRLSGEQAIGMWRRLGEANPENATVQLAILEQVAILSQQPEFAAQTVERLAQITGPTGRRWRLEKTRWLLVRRTPEAALEAADLLRMLIRQSGGGIDSVDQRVLLAEAVSIAGALASATEHLQSAYLLDPTRGDVGLRLIALHERSGRADDARRLLGRLAAEGVSGPRHRLEVAARLAQIAETETAIALLEQSEAAGELDEAARAYLAELMHRAGRIEDALALYRELLLLPSPAPGTILSAAIFLERTGSSSEAAQVLRRLEGIDFSPVERQVVTAVYRARTGDIPGARALFAESLAQSPRFASPWRQAAAFEISCGNAAEALAIAQQARQRGVADLRLDAIALQAQALDSTAGQTPPSTAFESLASLLAQRPEVQQWRGSSALLTAAASALREGRTPQLGELALLEGLAETFSHFPPLHEALVEAYGSARMPAERARAAMRWAEAMPQSAAAQQRAFEAVRDLGAVAQAEFCALRWREVASEDPVWADAALAEVRLLGGNYSRAADLLEPHLLRAAGNPAQLARLLALAAEAHAGVGDYEAAWDLVAPHLADSPGWRKVAIRLASQRISDAREAVTWLSRIEEVLNEISSANGSTAAQTLAEDRLAVAGAWVDLGVRFAVAEAIARGRSQLEQLTAASLAQSADAWQAMASAARAADSPSQAQMAYRRALALDPRRALAANELARLLLASEDPSLRGEALTWARMAAEQDPGEARFQATLGRACIASRQSEQAQEAFERALRLDDEHLEAMLGLATLLLQSGDLETAARWHQKLLPIYEASPPNQVELRAEFAGLQRQLGGTSQ